MRDDDDNEPTSQLNEQSRDNINDTTVDSLGKQVERANKLFRNALKARQLKLDADAFDTISSFSNSLTSWRQRRGTQSEEQGKGRSQTQDETGPPLKAPEDRCGGAESEGLGPLALEVKEKKARTQRARQKVDESQRVRPEEDKQATDRMISEIARILDAYGGEGIPYLSFVLNPHSFAQSVENIFYFSFLVRDGRACIEEEINEDSSILERSSVALIALFVIIDSCEAPDGNNDAEGSKSQFVFELTQELWKVSRRMHLSLARRSPNSWSRALSRMLPQQEAIDVFDVQASAIPHRAKFQEQTNAKWR
ncbi:BZ3501_MvSof-1269-A2-R1_C44g00223 [Microbotryum saponariae]|nr:BZ3501_MvSof-1269-A2-R1_C44g00223 [Microbotryum saponariae]